MEMPLGYHGRWGSDGERDRTARLRRYGDEGADTDLAWLLEWPNQRPVVDFQELCCP